MIEVLLLPAFIAGVLTFLSPCTLPLVPGYLAFISGSFSDKKTTGAHNILQSAFAYVLGFGTVFVLLGVLFGMMGQYVVRFQGVLSVVGGLVMMLLGLWMILPSRPMFFFRLPMLPLRHKVLGWAQPGKPWGAALFGVAFALGWTPCVGPVLGTLLLLASSTATAWQGTLLLAVFSVGLAVPYMLVALGVSRAQKFIAAMGPRLRGIQVVGGVVIMFIGILLLTRLSGVFIARVFELLQIVRYEDLLRLL